MNNNNDGNYDPLDPIFHHEQTKHKLMSIIQIYDELLDGMGIKILARNVLSVLQLMLQ